MNPLVDAYIAKTSTWHDEIVKLRAILLDCQLGEELKWRVPCYTFQNKNILLIGVFKEYCTLSFFKGVLLQDTNGILHSPGDNSQSVRMIKITSVKEIVALKKVLTAYIYEAIEVEKAGLKVELKDNTKLEYVEELQHKLKENKAFKKSFEALTPGRQRAYNLYFSDAKQSETRISRIEKYMPRILSGKGINDCTCGLSKKMPGCDGSHKSIR